EEFAGKMARCPHCTFVDSVPLDSAPAEAFAPVAGWTGPMPTDEEKEPIYEEPPTPSMPPEEDRDAILEAPVTQPPAAETEQRRKFAHNRRRLSVMIAGLLLLVTALGVAWAWNEARKARQKEDETALRRQEAERFEVTYFATLVHRRGVPEGVG